MYRVILYELATDVWPYLGVKLLCCEGWAFCCLSIAMLPSYSQAILVMLGGLSGLCGDAVGNGLCGDAVGNGLCGDAVERAAVCCARLGSLLSWAVLLYFSHLATIVLLSSYPYAILMRVACLLASVAGSCTHALICFVL